MEKKLTPMMEQWQECKQGARDALLLFRLGDFYEAFFEDAVLLSKLCDLVLTKRGDVPMSGIPAHTVDGYIDRLVGKGYRVAVAEQVEDAALAKGLVKRKIVRLLTPGTVVNSSLVQEKEHQYLCALTQVGHTFALASLDMTTGRFMVAECESEKELFDESARLSPRECLTSLKFQERHLGALKGSFVTAKEEAFFDHEKAYATLKGHFQVHHLDGFGLKGKVAAINAAGALLAYLEGDLFLPISHVRTLHYYCTQDFLLIDATTASHLELKSLLSVIDKTLTPMGGRLFCDYLKKPLLNVERIKERQKAVTSCMSATSPLKETRLSLAKIRDIERLMMKVCTRFASPCDLIALKEALLAAQQLKEKLSLFAATPLIEEARGHLFCTKELIALLERALVDHPCARLGEGEVFREGYHADLDELSQLSKSSKDYLAHYQTTLREETGIKTLKVGFTRVFGYFLEVSKGASKGMPAHFHKKQTLSNAERYTTVELEQYEHKLLSSEEKKRILTQTLFEELLGHVSAYGTQVLEIAQGIALIDCIAALAQLALENDYTCPHIDESTTLKIVGGRHPVVETMIPRGSFIPNDVSLDAYEQLMVITGPNMAGKSTYIRQVALIALMAQMGSFVPAAHAQMGIIDKIFTRIGASDDLTRGQSTFMVEMSETASILHRATSRSLVILDEVGRGTSTHDGLSIAWAVAEYLLTEEGQQAKTLFATHYCELTALESLHTNAINYHALVKEEREEVVFLHKIERGSTDKSYGIHVAKLAGLPLKVVMRAKEILAYLEQRQGRKEILQKIKATPPLAEQLLLFQ